MINYTNNENLLIKNLLANDASAFQHVVKQNNTKMVYVARSIVGLSIAEEIVQDAWIAIIAGLPKFEGRSSFKNWSLKIVRNIALTRLKRESRNIALGDSNDLTEISAYKNSAWILPTNFSDLDSPDALQSKDELQAVIFEAFALLTDVQQKLISMRYMRSNSIKEIACTLNLSESNTRVSLHRARNKIWKAINIYTQNN